MQPKIIQGYDQFKALMLGYSHILSGYAKELLASGKKLHYSEYFEGRSAVQAIEQIVLQHRGTNSMFITPEEFNRRNPRFSGFSSGCHNGCIFCYADVFAKPLIVKDYPIIAQEIFNFILNRNQDSDKRQSGFSSLDSDSLCLYDPICDAYLIDGIKFHNRCLSIFPFSPFPETPFFNFLLTSGYSPFEQTKVFAQESIKRAAEEKVDLKNFRFVVSYHLFRPQIEAAFIKFCQERSEATIHAIREAIDAFKHMYVEVINFGKTTHTDLVIKSLDPKEKNDPAFPGILKTIDDLQDIILEGVKKSIDHVINIQENTIDWSISITSINTVQRLQQYTLGGFDISRVIA